MFDWHIIVYLYTSNWGSAQLYLHNSVLQDVGTDEKKIQHSDTCKTTLYRSTQQSAERRTKLHKRLIPCRRVLKKFIVSQRAERSKVFVNDSSPCTHWPFTPQCPVSVESIPQTTSFTAIHFNNLLHLRPCLQVVSSLQDSVLNFLLLYHHRYVCCLFCMSYNTNYDVLYYIIFPKITFLTFFLAHALRRKVTFTYKRTYHIIHTLWILINFMLHLLFSASLVTYSYRCFLSILSNFALNVMRMEMCSSCSAHLR